MRNLYRLCVCGMAGAAVLLAGAGAIAGDGVMSKDIVRSFVENVRSGKHPDWADRYMAPEVQAHQVWSEGVETVRRTPEDYTAHVEEFIEAFGPFELSIEELIAEGDRVFVRWRQEGTHNVSLAGEEPTGKPLTELTSTVYRVEDGKIVEYWLQFDRKGMDIQITKAAKAK